MKTKELIYSMLTENTGSHLLDSGGAYGRNHQRNAKKTIDDFENEPEAWLDTKYGADVTISLFHHLVKTLDQDELCKQFNSLPCTDFDGDYFGIDKSQSAWLTENDFIAEGEAFNSYNWSSNFSQVMQGSFLKQGGYVDRYVLLQIHGGCDVRGGYTDAKLFLVDSDYFLDESASFPIGENKTLDIRGQDFSLYNHDTGADQFLNYDEAESLIIKQGEKIIHGSVYY